ncbi:hypothetical protein SDRG_17442 [Saprolegnia diclina VS20]|uniref:Uncharacterized protein n=1 Tax=Saprolegnia diclina (strain VS20) TaxID=1156394 RepID=T0PUJ8_SAPDV|nr:hypothetical protein SDRG_17442 [Saprolegnia diclina VS20]EQC24665.1 hypothetical protein SDRG_17442 [Saprolegnia diclina VS20]|eukprot:XP_008621906.1 hypothetical protein SDRG_17442 [Saprolegnia diclina VS20]
MVEMLVSHGAVALALDHAGTTPLLSAARVGNVAITRMLLSTLTSETMRPAIDSCLEAAIESKHWPVSQELLQSLRSNFSGNDMTRMAFLAATTGHLEMLHELLSLHPDLLYTLHDDKTTLLLQAAKNDHEEVVGSLLARLLPTATTYCASKLRAFLDAHPALLSHATATQHPDSVVAGLLAVLLPESDDSATTYRVWRQRHATLQQVHAHLHHCSTKDDRTALQVATSAAVQDRLRVFGQDVDAHRTRVCAQMQSLVC